ncbi:MAG TPA: polyphenol oxidase family protein [Verrucomicrobiae bacterium]|nr:polyphenol oxidase family protein [Verrucomicrobiae bacterium]
MQFETFAPLNQLPFATHAFTLRTTEDTKTNDFEGRTLVALGFSPTRFASAEQTHGNGVAVIFETTGERVPMVDALATSVRGLPLVIRCADCAAVFIVDRRTPAIALVHSGRKGTIANIVGSTVVTMQQKFGTDPADCTSLISPSIGPCHYEMDIWSSVEQQLRQAGVSDVHNPRVCTACHLDHYFSYRAEKGQTGRMLAVLALKSP